MHNTRDFFYMVCDTDKPGASNNPTNITLGDNSCWLATAANILASADYKSINHSGNNNDNLQGRADRIFNDLKIWAGYTNANGSVSNTGSGGWIDTALTWWINSANNSQSNNIFTIVTVFGNKTRTPLQNNNLPTDIGNYLRENSKVGVSISWPRTTQNGGASGGHAITAWGDDLGADDNLDKNVPGQIWITDSDRDNISADDIHRYNYDSYTNPNPNGFNEGNGWYFNYSANNPFIKHICTLSAYNLTNNSNNPLQLITGTYELDINSDINTIEYHVETEVKVYSYKTYICIGIAGFLQKIEISNSDIEEILLGNSDTRGLKVIKNKLMIPARAQKVFIYTEFWVPFWNSIHYKSVKISPKNTTTVKLFDFPGVINNIYTPLINQDSNNINILPDSVVNIDDWRINYNSYVEQFKTASRQTQNTLGNHIEFMSNGYLHLKLDFVNQFVSFTVYMQHEYSIFQNPNYHEFFIGLDANVTIPTQLKNISYYQSYGKIDITDYYNQNFSEKWISLDSNVLNMLNKNLANSKSHSAPEMIAKLSQVGFRQHNIIRPLGNNPNNLYPKEDVMYVGGYPYEFTKLGKDDNSIELPKGWSMFGYPCKESKPVNQAFSEITDNVIIIKNSNGLAYLPDWNYNGIGDLQFGKGYQIKMSTPSNIKFCNVYNDCNC